MSNFKFSKLHDDTEIQQIQKEVEDNFAIRTELDTKADKVETFVTVEPELINMNDGDEIAYDDGTNKWIYKRISAKLYKYQLTEV